MVYVTPIGYPVLYVYCQNLRCQHVGQVDPKLAREGKRFRCRVCQRLTDSLRLVWQDGLPPDNVVPFTRQR
jgi:hypothetical protein